ncbi:hypothetical protein LTSEUGA_1240 [Salmonella enterica subsp. enterica serovar Uganda str. R8-3404]|uniref:Uncharacterized protein n=1 Tax=Salmonella enterica subsp. enterica serovar Uganda str. R8-3404 TaxID=913083 RepID=A0A6C8H751_SALET|nr:hypothetical protein LTSEUGA_1240 [Salmonella enterica subsp. enterica serovar Uganda str. R8-3404]
MLKTRDLRYCSAAYLTSGIFMRNRTLADLDRVVALGGGHGLGPSPRFLH